MPDSLLAIGSYAPAHQPGIHVAQLTGGRLELLDSFAGVADPSWLARHPTLPVLYAVSEQEIGQVVAVHLAITSAPAMIATVPSGGSLPCHLSVHPSGRWLAVANYGSGVVRVIALDGEGGLVGTVDEGVIGPTSGIVADRQDGPHAHTAQYSPDGALLLTTDLGTDEVLTYRVAGDGRLSDRRSTPTRPGSGPRHLAFAGGGRIVCAIHELDGTVTSSFLDPAGSLERRDAVTVGHGGLAAGIVATHDGRRLYVTVRGDDTVATVDVGADGTLRVVGTAPSCGQSPRALSLTPNEQHLLVTNQLSDEVSLLPVGPEGAGPPTGRLMVPQPTCAVVLRP